MQTAAIVEGFDVLEDRGPRLHAGIEREVIQPLGFQRVEETLDGRVVVAVAGTAHAADDPVAIEPVLILGARVRAATIAVVDQAPRRTAQTKGLVKGIQGESLRRAGCSGPPDHAAGARIEEDGKEEPALPRAYLRDIGEPEVVGRWRLEVLPDAVGRGGRPAGAGGAGRGGVGPRAPRAPP